MKKIESKSELCFLWSNSEDGFGSFGGTALGPTTQSINYDNDEFYENYEDKIAEEAVDLIQRGRKNSISCP